MNYTIKDVNVKNIFENPANPRKEFNESELKGLSESITNFGILQPLLVQEQTNNKFILIAGARRLKASILAKLESVPCAILEKNMNAEEMELAMTVENSQRVNLSPIEEAEEYEKLSKIHKMTPEQIAVKVGRHPYYIYTRMKFLKLSPLTRKSIGIAPGFTIQHALELTRINHSQQEEVIQREFDQNYNNDYPSVKELRKYIENRYMLNLSNAPFETKFIYSEIKTCKECKDRTGAQITLFDESKNDLCLNPECWAKKKELEIKIKIAKYSSEGKKVYKMEDLEKDGRSETIAKLSDKPENSKYNSKTKERYAFKEVLKDVKEIELIPVIMPDGSIEECVDIKQVLQKIPSKYMHTNSSHSNEIPKPQGTEGRYKRRLEIAKEKAEPIATSKALREAAEKLVTKMKDKEFHTILADILKGIVGQGGYKNWVRAFNIERPKKIAEYGIWQSHEMDKHLTEYVKKNPTETLLMIIFMGRCVDYNCGLSKGPGTKILELAEIDYKKIFKNEYDKLVAAIPIPGNKSKVPEDTKKDIKQQEKFINKYELNEKKK